MNISYKWLKRYIDFDLQPRELAAVLTSLGLECDTVEEVESIRGGLKGIVIGKVLTCEEHPNSDHLHITTCDLGTGEPVQIVCGAPNVAAGQTVVVATVGTTLYSGDQEFQIKKSKIRGVESFGMICAEDEIGVGNSHDGIMVLDTDLKPGTPAAQYFNVESDYMLEVELTPNRVDAASHYGTARDLKAYMACNNPEGPMPEIYTPSTADFAPATDKGVTPITVEDTEGCPRYSGVTIRNVKVGESPEWLKQLLTATGQRPINNIVDITNFVLLGLGQPLHCFDLDKVAGGKIVVRTCPEGTKFTTLDGVERTLSDKDLMICDDEKPMCIAGVFGGLDSGVTENTTNVFIESAYFNPTRIRRTARRHGLSTDASFRYERGTDPNITVDAAKVAACMIRELAGGTICGDVVDVYPTPVPRAEIKLNIEYCNNLIGKQIPLDTIKRILTSLEIDILEGSTDEDLLLAVPTYRVDVTRPCDVVEEILRVYGYNNVDFGMEIHATLSQKTHTDLVYALQDKVSDRLTAQGFNEIWCNSLSSSAYYAESKDYPLDTCVQLMNPLSSELSVMRRTLLYGGLESISRNVNRKAPDLRFYEFGHVYRLNPGKESTRENPLAPYGEHASLALWMTGDIDLAGWNTKAKPVSVFDLKSVVLEIMHTLGIPAAMIALTPGESEVMSVQLNITTKTGKQLGALGVLRRPLLDKFDISQDVVYAELDWDALCALAAKSNVKFAPLPKTQPVKRDLALLIDKNIDFARIEDIVRRSERKLLKDVTLFDVYEGKNLPDGKKSYAISMTLQDDEKTLNDKQIDAVMNKIIANLKKEVSAELR